MGPTASGKSDVAERLADRFGLTLISADAFMVYKGLDIGTNKPARKSDYELIDIVEPFDEFGVGEFVLRAAEALNRFWDAGKGVVIVGGTGFYIRALLEKYDDLMPPPSPSLRAELMMVEASEGLDGLVTRLTMASPRGLPEIDLKNPVRVRRAIERTLEPRSAIRFDYPDFKVSKFVLDPSGTDEAIHDRTRALLTGGWIEETTVLLQRNIEPTAPGFRAIGYDCVIGVVQGALSITEAEASIVAETRQYARRQRTWLRSEPGVTRRFEGNVGSDFSKACAEEIAHDCFV